MRRKPSPPNSPVPERRVKGVDRRVAAGEPDFRALIEQSVQGVLIHRNFKPLYVNQAFADLFGYATSDDILALPILRRLIPKDNWARVEEEYDDLIRGRKTHVIGRACGVRRDGREIWTAVTERVVDWQGAPAIHLTAFDITAQMEAEQALLHNEQHLRAILEILPQPIYIARRDDGRLLYVNRKTCLLFQRRASELLRSTSVDFYVDPQEREDLRQLFETLNDIRDVEVRMKTTAGRQFTAEIAAIAVDYGGGPAILVALNDVSQRKELEAELFHQANTDSLTGVSNRRFFLTQAEQEWRRSRRFARDLSVMMVDVDHFKPINDQYGHAVGDAVLQGIVKRAMESLRQSDMLGRIGGEEFAVLMPETTMEAALDAAERLRKHIADRSIVADLTAIPCTVSVGVAHLSSADDTVEQLLNQADAALYRAKANGRNRVEG